MFDKKLLPKPIKIIDITIKPLGFWRIFESLSLLSDIFTNICGIVKTAVIDWEEKVQKRIFCFWKIKSKSFHSIWDSIFAKCQSLVFTIYNRLRISIIWKVWNLVETQTYIAHRLLSLENIRSGNNRCDWILACLWWWQSLQCFVAVDGDDVEDINGDSDGGNK